jgi:two-component system nitrate/nitrite response regulator NarL
VRQVRQSGSRPNPGSARSASKPVKVLIVDDHPVVRRGLRSCLAGNSHVVVAGEAADGQEALAKAKQLSPQVMLIDIDLPKLDGLAVAEILNKENRDIKVVLLSVHDPDQYRLRIIQSGARGFIAKTAPAREFARAVQTVAAGGTMFSLDFARTALEQVAGGPRISPRERQVLAGIAAGCSNKEIASRLRVSVRTVETHRGSIKRKLNIQTIAGLTKFAIQKGLLSP